VHGTAQKITGTVIFYNDSKATNIASTLAACRCFKSPVNLLLGGVSKGQDFGELFAKLPPVVENVFVYGASADEIMNASKLDSIPPFVKGVTRGSGSGVLKCTDLGDAVHRATTTGTGPRVVLLSPACASFDQFNNYEHRGQTFTEIVHEIIK